MDDVARLVPGRVKERDMKLSEMKRSEDVLTHDLEDPQFRAEWERTASARIVAHRVLAFRAEHGVSQAELGSMLGMKQSAVARLEAGEHNPGLETLTRLSNALGIEFAIDITPAGKDSTFISPSPMATLDESFESQVGSQVRVLTS